MDWWWFVAGLIVFLFFFLFGERDSLGQVNPNEVMTPGLAKQEYEELCKTQKYVYLDPENGPQSWNGEGKQPIWVAKFLRDGGNLEDIEVN